MKISSFPLALLVCSAALSGCSNALNGAKQDADKNTQAVRDTAAQTGQVVKETAQQTGQAIKAVPTAIDANTVLRPAIKTAIIRDPVLNNPKNLVEVGIKDRTVILSGYVAEAGMKLRAVEDAQVVLKNNHSDFTVVDTLKVQP